MLTLTFFKLPCGYRDARLVARLNRDLKQSLKATNLFFEFVVAQRRYSNDVIWPAFADEANVATLVCYTVGVNQRFALRFKIRIANAVTAQLGVQLRLV